MILKQSSSRGSVLVPALIVVTMLGALGLSMLSGGLSGHQAVTRQKEGYQLQVAAEGAASLAIERLWSAYLREQGGAAGDLASFRAYLSEQGLAEGVSVDRLQQAGLPQDLRLGGARVQGLNITRRDSAQEERTELTVEVRTSGLRGENAGNATAEALRIVFAVAPSNFEGFDYAILTKNVNCVFCHTVIDNAERCYNLDAAQTQFAKVKVGTLQSLELRSDVRPQITDSDADSVVAGTLYVRGKATNAAGVPISNWGSQSALSCAFDSQGYLQTDEFGNLTTQGFAPGLGAGANLYLDYPSVYSQMPDGPLPTDFPAPFPDDGGIDPSTGQPTSVGAGNKLVDPAEFYAATLSADGTIHGGAITQLADGATIQSGSDWAQATSVGNVAQLGSATSGHVVLTGTQENPILIDGDLAIDGDVIIQGWIKGKGTILASGNIYVPTSLQYLDGNQYMPGDEAGHPTGPTTFGIAQDGTPNVLGLAAGGNVLIGDYQAPGAAANGGPNDIITGGPDSPWNFTMAEIAMFNRTEWSYTQPLLPGYGEDPSNPATWTAVNPYYQGEDYVPRYYQYGPGDPIPIYNLGTLYFDVNSGTWRGPEAAFGWDMSLLTLADPNNPNDPLLFDPTSGEPIATVLSATPDDGWISEQVYQDALEAWQASQPAGTPLTVDGLLYTNNAIFGIVARSDRHDGQLVINGSLVCADLGLLAPGKRSPGTIGSSQNVPGSPYKVGLRLNYDRRTKGMLNVLNPLQVAISRVLWTPIAP